MKHQGKLFLLAVLLLAIVPAIRSSRKIKDRRRERQAMVQPLQPVTLAPLAIGRYLVDLPKGSELHGWFQIFLGTGPVLTAKGITPEQYRQITDQQSKEREINSQFIQGDAYYLLEGQRNRFENSLDREPDRLARPFRGFQGMLRSIQPRRHDELPTLPGTCFDEAFLRDGPDRDYREIVMVSGVWPDRPDVRFHFSIFDNGPHLVPPLLQRLAERKRLEGPAVLRSGARKLGPNEGEEHLERVTSEDGKESHLFIWEAQGVANRWDRPQIHIELSTGRGGKAPRDASLSDADALALWDRILETWRWRPVKGA